MNLTGAVFKPQIEFECFTQENSQKIRLDLLDIWKHCIIVNRIAIVTSINFLNLLEKISIIKWKLPNSVAIYCWIFFITEKKILGRYVILRDNFSEKMCLEHQFCACFLASIIFKIILWLFVSSPWSKGHYKIFIPDHKIPKSSSRLQMRLTNW